MKLLRGKLGLIRGVRPFVRRAALGIVCVGTWLAGLCLVVARVGAEEDIFQSAILMEISIEIPADGLQLLRGGGMSPMRQKKPQARATLATVSSVDFRRISACSTRTWRR